MSLDSLLNVFENLTTDAAAPTRMWRQKLALKSFLISIIALALISCGSDADDPLATTDPAALTISAQPTPASEEPVPSPSSKSWVRPNVKTLDPAGPEIAALRNGIAAMKNRPASDPTSWLYQANMHGTYDTPARPAWNSCQHGSFFFLSWHRMYLYYFERILRSAAQDPDLALPYWDYTDPTQRAIPPFFRSPAVASNAFFVAQRATGINQGAQLPASATTFSTPMSFTNFSSPTGSGLSFGGQTVSGPTHFSGTFGQIESQPHNIIHVLVGGQTGWMVDPNLAARDPIFYFHHANIDRLWNVWISMAGGRINPSSGNWLTQTFTFFDENGLAVQMTGAEVVDSAAQLSYTYAPGTGSPSQPQPESVAEALPSAPFVDSHQELLGERGDITRLGGETTRVSVGIPLAVPEGAEVGERRQVVVLEGINFGQPGLYYEVYAGLPDDEQASSSSPYYVGNLAIFGQLADGSTAHEHGPDSDKMLSAGATLAYDITRIVEALRRRPNFAGDVPLHFEPRGLVMPDLPGAEAAPAAREVTIENIKILLE